MEKFVIFYFRLRSGKILPIKYWLQPNSIREKWISLVKEREELDEAYLDLKVINKNQDDLPFLRDKLNGISTKINKLYGKERLPLLEESVEHIDQDKLNYLHEMFEEYGEESMDPIRFHSEEAHNAWLSLNEWIHITEVAMVTSTEDFPCYSCLCSIYPPYPGEPLEPSDKMFLDTEFPWGSLYLGYNTLGKDYAAAMYDNDVRVITNGQIKIQTHYSTEIWANFSSSSENLKSMEVQFKNWYDSLDEETQNMIPIHDRDQLSLGRYYLGNVVLDETFLTYNPDKNAWRYDLELQKKWNNEVFSQGEELVGIEIEDENEESRSW